MEIKSTTELTTAKCVPCEGGVPKLTAKQAAEQILQTPGWEIVINNEQGDRIRKEWRLKNFMQGIAFFNDIAQLAESEGHHPDLHLVGYRNLSVEIWTHAIGGLSENDFILAAKIDQLEF